MKKTAVYGILLGLTILVISGCGRREENTKESSLPEVASDSGEVSDGEASAAAALREPPAIELQPLAGEGNSLLVKSCGYNWNWPEGKDQMASVIADSASPLSEGASWDVLTLPDNGKDAAEYRLIIEGKPDESGVRMWNLSDIGNADAPGSPASVYQGDGDFTIELQAGKIYEIYLEWEQEKVAENGCFGIAYYIFKTAWPVQEEAEDSPNELTETDNEAGQEASSKDFPEATFGEADTEDVDSVDGITMTVTQVSPEGASLEIRNRTEREVTLGADYALQAWHNEGWYQVNYIIDNAAFNAVGYMARNGEPLRLDVEWTFFHGILPEGRYRITKTVIVQEGEDSVKYRLAAEFDVV